MEDRWTARHSRRGSLAGQGTRRHGAAGFGRHEAQSTRTVTGAGRAELGPEAEGEAGLRWKDGSRDESKSQSAQGLRDDSHSARRLRGENARLLSILACREQELHELKNLDSADHGTFKCVREVVLASLYLEPLNRVRSA